MVFLCPRTLTRHKLAALWAVRVPEAAQLPQAELGFQPRSHCCTEPFTPGLPGTLGRARTTASPSDPQEICRLACESPGAGQGQSLGISQLPPLSLGSGPLVSAELGRLANVCVCEVCGVYAHKVRVRAHKVGGMWEVCM